METHLQRLSQVEVALRQVRLEFHHGARSGLHRVSALSSVRWLLDDLSCAVTRRDGELMACGSNAIAAISQHIQRHGSMTCAKQVTYKAQGRHVNARSKHLLCAQVSVRLDEELKLDRLDAFHLQLCRAQIAALRQRAQRALCGAEHCLAHAAGRGPHLRHVAGKAQDGGVGGESEARRNGRRVLVCVGLHGWAMAGWAACCCRIDAPSRQADETDIEEK